MLQNQDRLTIADVAVKANIKVEVYRVLTTEGGVYLPPIKEWNYQYVRDIITGNKLVGSSYKCTLAYQGIGCHM